MRWFESGEHLTNETLKRLTREITLKQLDALKNLGKRKPSKKTLQESIAKSLEDSKLGDNLPKLLDENTETKS